MISSIIFLILETRPNIAFAILVASRFVKNPRSQNTEVIKTILQYFKDFREREIIYDDQEKLLIEGYSDSN